MHLWHLICALAAAFISLMQNTNQSRKQDFFIKVFIMFGNHKGYQTLQHYVNQTEKTPNQSCASSEKPCIVFTRFDRKLSERCPVAHSQSIYFLVFYNYKSICEVVLKSILISKCIIFSSQIPNQFFHLNAVIYVTHIYVSLLWLCSYEIQQNYNSHYYFQASSIYSANVCLNLEVIL